MASSYETFDTSILLLSNQFKKILPKSPNSIHVTGQVMGIFPLLFWLFLVISPQGMTDSALKGTFFHLAINLKIALCVTDLCFFLNVYFSTITLIYFVCGPTLLQAQVQVWGSEDNSSTLWGWGWNSGHQG